MPALPGEAAISVVVPVRNGERWLGRTLEAVLADAGSRSIEILVVDDGSDDASRTIVEAFQARDSRVRLLDGERRGAAAAINTGIRAARHDLLLQIDQDVEVLPGWLPTLDAALDDPQVGAAQGVYVPDRDAPVLERVMALDLALRYDRIQSRSDHVCTGNTAYRKSALAAAGLLDETLGYGYDNDLSYRLVSAGYRLVICPGARSLHHWRASVAGYLSQQYGFGYGRLDVLARHPRRVTGDAVSPAGMMAHPVVFAISLGAAITALVLQRTGGRWRTAAAVSLALLATLGVERAWAGIRAARRHRDWTALLFPIVHLARDAAWLAAAVTWSIRRLLGRSTAPSHSMRPRPALSVSDSGPNRPRT
jgi:cellulose synthase/poly-beta-1,6-N-acetylglucosamine synthase-like glycosyltransferase